MADKKSTDSGIEIKTVYSKNDLPAERDEVPGDYPYTRGVQADMYRGKLWTMRQYAGFSTAEESNKRYHYLLNQGVSGLSVAFDLPTQIGYDSDHALAEGEVGKVGVAIDSIEDQGHPAGRCVNLNDHQCYRFYSFISLRGACKRTGGRPFKDHRYDPE
jgi:methylmalonyl-CoA mutase, N-terminal domain